MQTSGEPAASYRQLDILQHFLDHQDWTTTLPAATYDFVFCSAFLHHVPDTNWRAQLLTQLWGLTTPGGTLAISFWQFLTHPQLSRLIVQDLGHHDYLLSWRSSTTATRYCHHFSDSEIATYRRLLPSLSATAIADYRADGSNRYLVWHKKPRDTSPRGLKT
jgi:trans-aconitate methyltransferase